MHARTQIHTIILHSLLLRATGLIVVCRNSLREEEKHYWALLKAQLSNETEHIIAMEHQRLRLYDTYSIKSY